jgi:hypothetical protein
VASNIFSIIYGTILPIDELIFFQMVKTTNQKCGLLENPSIDGFPLDLYG